MVFKLKQVRISLMDLPLTAMVFQEEVKTLRELLSVHL